MAKVDRRLLVTFSDVFHLKIHRAEVPSRFVCVMQPFSIVFCVIRTAHKFDFRPVINEAPHKWRPAFVKETALWSDRALSFLTASVRFTPTVVTSVKDYPHCAGKLNSFLNLKVTRQG